MTKTIEGKKREKMEDIREKENSRKTMRRRQLIWFHLSGEATCPNHYREV